MMVSSNYLILLTCLFMHLPDGILFYYIFFYLILFIFTPVFLLTETLCLVCLLGGRLVDRSGLSNGSSVLWSTDRGVRC